MYFLNQLQTELTISAKVQSSFGHITQSISVFQFFLCALLTGFKWVGLN